MIIQLIRTNDGFKSLFAIFYLGFEGVKILIQVKKETVDYMGSKYTL